MNEQKNTVACTALDGRIEAEQLRQIATSAKAGMFIAPFFPSLVGLILYLQLVPALGEIPLQAVGLIAGLQLLNPAIGLVLLGGLPGASDVAKDLANWRRRITLACLKAPVIMAASFLLLWQPGSAINHMFVETMFLSASVVFIGIHASHRRVLLQGQVVIFTALIARALFGSTPIDIILAVLSLPFALIVLRFGLLLNQHITDGLALRFRNETLAEDLTIARDEALHQRQEALAANKEVGVSGSHEPRAPHAS